LDRVVVKRATHGRRASVAGGTNVAAPNSNNRNYGKRSLGESSYGCLAVHSIPERSALVPDEPSADSAGGRNTHGFLR
jgi:hypothetical protein